MEGIDDILATAGLQLVRRPEGLSLTDGAMSVRGDFTRMRGRLRPGNLSRELLVRAAKVKHPCGEHPTAVDATAGLGEDSLLLAAAGFHVVLFERNPVIAALLRDALERARHLDKLPESPGLDGFSKADDPAGLDGFSKTSGPTELDSISEAIARAWIAEGHNGSCDQRNPDCLVEAVSRMSLVEGDSAVAMAALDFRPDIVLLDPMFPGKSKDSAAKKKLQMLQKLEQPCEDEAALMEAACAAAPRKVVVKRPAKGPHLASRTPSYTLAGKAIRYDVYVL